jgi:pimeloyl-ACP methyl ester carboxylesterase
MSHQTHLRSDLPCDDGTGLAYWAIEPIGRALVFVHGFAGSPSDTWLQFDSMLQAEGSCRGYDMLYYAYDSLRRQVRPSGGLFRQFLHDLFTEPVAIANRAIGETFRREPFSYERVTLVAHSMGAVVSRIALIGAYRQREPWLPRTRLILFAPVHKGARVQMLAMGALTGFRWAGGLIGAAPYFFPPLKDLEPDSPVLRQMLSDTDDAVARPEGAPLLAVRILQGLEDNVIVDERFSADPEEIVIPHKGHRSVCKPTSNFPRPVREVVEAM